MFTRCLCTETFSSEVSVTQHVSARSKSSALKHLRRSVFSRHAKPHTVTRVHIKHVTMPLTFTQSSALVKTSSSCWNWSAPLTDICFIISTSSGVLKCLPLTLPRLKMSQKIMMLETAVVFGMDLLKQGAPQEGVGSWFAWCSDLEIWYVRMQVVRNVNSI